MNKKDKNIRKLTRAGSVSLAVVIPADMIDELGWREKQKVKVKRIKGGIEIRDWRRS